MEHKALDIRSLLTKWKSPQKFKQWKTTKQPVRMASYQRSSAVLCPLPKMSHMWDSKNFPKHWATSILLPVPKKSSKTIHANCRSTSLIITGAKFILTALLNRFTDVRDSRTRSTQCGFRWERDWIDQIIILRRILERRCRLYQLTTAWFSGFRAELDSFDRHSLWSIFRNEEMS